MRFDVTAARKEGYSDAEIAGVLASRSSFDLEGARKEGWQDSDIIDAILKAGPRRREAASVTDAEIEGASRPAQMTLTKGGRSELQPNAPLPDDEPEAAWGDVVESLPAQFVAGTRSAAANLRQMKAQESVAQREEVLKPQQADPSGWGALVKPGAIARQKVKLEEDKAALEQAKADANQAGRDMRLVTPENMTVAQEALSSLAQSSSSTMLGLAAGILTRNIPVAFAIAGGGGAAQQAGATYGEALAHGADHRQASMAATMDALLEAGGEMLPLGYALKPGTPIYQRIFGTIARESGQEAATQFAQDLRAKAMENPDLTLGEMWRNLQVAALAGAGGGVVYGGAGGAANWAREREAKQNHEADTAAAVESIGQAQTVDEAITTAVAAAEVPADQETASTTVEDTQDRVAAPVDGPEGAQGAAQAQEAGGQPTAIQESQPVTQQDAQVVNKPEEQAAPVMAFGKTIGEMTDMQLRVAARYGANPALSQAARTEIDRRKAAEGTLEAGTQSSTPEVKESGSVEAQPSEVRVFGRPVEQLTDKELTVVARAHRMEAFRSAARAEINRRALPEDAGPAQAGASGAVPGNVGYAEGASADSEAKDDGSPSMESEALPIAGTKPATLHTKQAEIEKDAPAEADAEHAAVGIALTPPYRGAEEAVESGDTRHARPDAIRQAIRDMFNVPLNEGRIPGSKAKLGIYKVKARTIRVRNQNDVGVITHELGHHISETSRPIRKARKKFDAELREITPYAAQQKTEVLQREEGMAEFVRYYLTAPSVAAKKAPGFFLAFDDYVTKEGLKPALEEIGSRIWDWQRLPPADRILAKVGEAEPDFRKTWNVDRAIFEVLDNWLPLKRMVEDLKPNVAPRADPFKLAHLLSGDAAIIEDWMLRETVPFSFERRANLKDRGKPLSEILKPVEKQQKEFAAYLIAKRANELMKRDKEHLYSQDEINAGLKLETPEFKQAAKEIYEYQDQLLDYAVEGGLLAQRVADKFRRFPNYVPFFRVGEPIGQRGDIFRTIKGGTQNLRDPIANIIENTVRVIHATNRNFVLNTAHNLAREVPGGGRWIEDVPMPERAVKLETMKILQQLRSQGVEIDAESAEALATSQTFFVKNPFGDDQDRVMVLRRQGRPVAVQINDDMLWHALERFEPVDMGLVEKLLSVPADILRAGIVLSPDFMARNFARDTLSGFIQSKKGLIPVAGTLEGFKEVATRSDAARLYRAFGGAFGDMWRADRGFERKLVERMARHGGFDPRTIVTPRGLISLLHRMGSVAEAGTRVAEFKQSMESGDIDSLIDAAYNAREVSVDFGMHGHSRSVRFLTRITVFLNPALQGYYKAVRTGKGQPFSTLLRGGAMAAASILLYLNNRDEDWYKDIEQWERNVYWHVDIGLRDPQTQVIPLRIPKPFEWGGIFGSIPEALAQVSVEQHGKDFAKRLTSILDDVFTIRVIPSALVVPAELWANKNQFTGRAIVPEAKERLAPELQTTTGTTTTARKLGELTDTSPAKIDHAIRGLFGTLGTYAAMLADQAIHLTGEKNEALPLPWPRMPVARAFFRDPSGSNSKDVTDFYELLKSARQADQSLKHMDDERMAAYYEKHKAEIENRRSAEKVARQMAKLRRENEALRKDRDAPEGERVKMIVENNRQIRWLARDFMQEVRSGEQR